MKYLWTEDTGAGLHFWQLINRLFFDDAFVIESKGSNQGLLDALSDLDIKEDDKYYIAFDYVVDNQDIRNKYRMLNSIADKSEGKIIILDMIYSETILSGQPKKRRLPPSYFSGVLSGSAERLIRQLQALPSQALLIF